MLKGCYLQYNGQACSPCNPYRAAIQLYKIILVYLISLKIFIYIYIINIIIHICHNNNTNVKKITFLKLEAIMTDNKIKNEYYYYYICI